MLDGNLSREVTPHLAKGIRLLTSSSVPHTAQRPGFIPFLFAWSLMKEFRFSILATIPQPTGKSNSALFSTFSKNVTKGEGDNGDKQSPYFFNV
jgi:hypothetical protein